MRNKPLYRRKGKDTGLSYCFRRESTSLRISNHQGASCRYSHDTTREVQNNSNLTSFKCTLQVAMPPGNWQRQTQSPLEECSINVDSKHYCRQQTEKQVKDQQAIHRIKCTSSINREHRKSCSLTRSNQRYANKKTT